MSENWHPGVLDEALLRKKVLVVCCLSYRVNLEQVMLKVEP
jgi:hypothetical protein